MGNIIFFDLSLFSMFIMITLLLVIFSKHELITIRGRLFRWLIISTLVMLFIEILSWLFDGEPGNTAYILNLIFNTIASALPTIVPALWAIYIDYMIFTDVKRIKAQLHIYITPPIIMTIISILNVFYPILFVINENNVFSRLPGSWTSIILVYLIYLYLLVMVFINRRQLSSNFLFGVLMFLVIPLAAGVIQMLNLGLILIWPSVAVAILFSYLLFETTSSSMDYLTGLYTRNRAEDSIRVLMRKRRSFSVVMMDMDNFKQVNDELGHHVGDKLLIEMGRILTQVYGRKDIVARYGGDEFIIVSETVNSGSIKFIRKEINRYMGLSTNEYIRNAQFSMGVAYCTNSNSCTVDQMLIEADNNMYLDKAKNKNQKRRKDDKD